MMDKSSFIGRFLALESAAGIILIVATLLAMILKNSPLAADYQSLLMLPVGINIGELGINKPFLLWINDGFMAIFFLVVGLEIKRELIEGHLQTNAQRVLPFIGAIGGVAIPAGVYLLFNWENQLSRHGWAIPTATDIAFALGILALAGKNVPVTLKIFLMALAIFDDFIAIVVVAIFYTSELSLTVLGLSLIGIVGLIILNLCQVSRVAAYILVGLFVWVCVLKSGVHATLAGVVTGLLIPLKISKKQPSHNAHLKETILSPSKSLIHSLHPWVAFGILPLFAFANAGISLEGFDVQKLFHPIPLGIILGLFVGKQLGVFSFCWIAIKLGIAKLPDKATWLQLYAISILCGIGFTMSLFIGALAFQYGGAGDAKADRLAILIGSMSSALIGFLLLKASVKNTITKTTNDAATNKSSAD
ncbi:Na+/H+ antiporter NhaA [Aliikangiella maris]|uniref:Na+/H+ antiporter NhaA n=2 Tax=Aliikangiella maris TaxID=3162458 RepID=A0ABV3MQY9_9GAMM